MTKLISIILAGVMALAIFNASGQKLPNVQKASVWSPANIKINGKADEWGDRYQAYNNATEIYYTLSNDGENLYLTIKIKRGLVIEKVIKGGISFTINHTLNKKDGSPVIVTYPVLNRADRNSLSNVLNSKYGVNDLAAGMDNSLEGLNNLLATKSKSIGIKGIKSIPDDDISVYNEDGIKAVSRFDKPLVYIYELAVPLKYLDLSNNSSGAFSYHIKMNVEDESTHTFAPPIVVNNSNLPPPPPPASASVAPTDFWGEYTLAKKPL